MSKRDSWLTNPPPTHEERTFWQWLTRQPPTPIVRRPLPTTAPKAPPTPSDKDSYSMPSNARIARFDYSNGTAKLVTRESVAAEVSSMILNGTVENLTLENLHLLADVRRNFIINPGPVAAASDISASEMSREVRFDFTQGVGVNVSRESLLNDISEMILAGEVSTLVIKGLDNIHKHDKKITISIAPNDPDPLSTAEMVLKAAGMKIKNTRGQTRVLTPVDDFPLVSEPSVTSKIHAIYPDDVYARDDKGEIERTRVNGHLVPITKHKKGDPVLDDLGNPIVIDPAGDSAKVAAQLLEVLDKIDSVNVGKPNVMFMGFKTR